MGNRHCPDMKVLHNPDVHQTIVHSKAYNTIDLWIEKTLPVHA